MEHVARRGGRYFWRSRIPADLVQVAGRKEFTCSLGTADHRIARSSAARLGSSLDEVWTSARRAMGMATTEEALRNLLTGLLAALKDNIDRQFRSLPPRPSTLLIDRLDMENEYRLDVASAVDDLLAKVKHAESLEGKSAQSTAMAKAVGPEVVAAMRVMLDGLGVASLAGGAPPMFTKFVEETFQDERLLREDSHRHIMGYVQLFARIAGDKPIADYKRKDIMDWIRTLEKIKKTYGKTPRDRTKTIPQIVKESKNQAKLGATTITKHKAHIRAIFISANRHHSFAVPIAIDNMFCDIPLSSTVSEAEERKSWTIAQLNGLFSTPIWTGTRSRLADRTKRHQPGPHIHRDAYWWLPIAALWTGARLEELAQLRNSDLQYDAHGIPYLKLRKDAHHKFKTKNSERNIPIHPWLVEIGFLKLFDTKGRIFPELIRHGRPPTWGGLYSSHFTDYRKACGLYEPLRDFHSFRHNVISGLRSRGKADALKVASIVGHDASDPEFKRVQQTNDYTDYSIDDLYSEICKLNWQAWGLDVSNLLPR